MKAVAAALTSLSQPEITRLEREGTVKLNLNGAEVEVESSDVEIISEDIPGWQVANDGSSPWLST